MSIFTNYDNLSPDYIPNNISEKKHAEDTTKSKSPRIVQNAKGEFLGYCWYNGEKFEFKVSTDYTQEEIENKTLTLVIYNFRGETVFEKSENNSISITIEINDEMNNLMPSGSYKSVLKCTYENKVEFEQFFNIAVL